MSINRVVLTGNLTRDPEIAATGNGVTVCRLGLAVNGRRKNNSTGEWEEKPNYFRITVWGAQGENCIQYLKKGRAVGNRRTAEWREWEAQDGQKRSSSISSLNPCSSSAGATTLATGTGSPAALARRRATSRSIPATSIRTPVAAGAPPTTTFRSKADDVDGAWRKALRTIQLG